MGSGASGVRRLSVRTRETSALARMAQQHRQMQRPLMPLRRVMRALRPATVPQPSTATVIRHAAEDCARAARRWYRFLLKFFQSRRRGGAAAPKAAAARAEVAEEISEP